MNLYTGPTTVTLGRLALTASGAILTGGAPISVAAGGIFSVAPGADAVTTTGGSGLTLSGGDTAAGATVRALGVPVVM